jgi:hypothetical protein
MYRKKLLLAASFCCLQVVLLSSVSAQSNGAVKIDASEVERIEKFLAADELKGRAVFTDGIDKAADFIAAEFKKAGLQPVNGTGYFQEFTMNRNRFISASGTINGAAVDPRNIVAFSSNNEIRVDEKSGYAVETISATDTLYVKIQQLLAANKDYVVFIDNKHMRMFNSLKRFRRESAPMKNNLFAILTNEVPSSYSFEFRQEVTPLKLKNVVGVLPGKKKKDEYVIFSGHYDHVGIGKPTAEGDSIYNGANDDASGTAAVIMLAKQFSKQKDNERSLIFAAFTAEETGGFGSKHFSGQYDPSKIVAMFNIEMIGTESKWGTNSAYITGYDKTDMGKILEKNLEGTDFKFYPDPYPDQNLFYRSDNATLAKLGVPAHTISTSKMDSEKYYHTADDEFETLDMANMSRIIEAIALSSKSIVEGKDTPARVK